MNLIGTSVFRNKPQKALDVHQTLLFLESGVWERDSKGSGTLHMANLFVIPHGYCGATIECEIVILMCCDVA